MSSLESRVRIYDDDVCSDDGEGCGEMVASSHQPRRPSVPFSLSPFLVVDGMSRKSFSYSMLPHEPIKLSILKLDGSSFEVEVMKTATILDLKEAVESVFSFMPKKGPGKISWRHLWARFCLSFDGQKLVRESDFITDYGIKDGDQLHFIHHVSNLASSTRKHSRTSRRSMKSFSRSSGREEEEESDKEDDYGDIENGKLSRNSSEEDFGRHKDSKTVHYMLGWFSYSRLATVENEGSKGKGGRRSKCGDALWSRVRKLIVFCGTTAFREERHGKQIEVS